MIELVRVNNHRPTILHLPDFLSFEAEATGEPRIMGMGTGPSLKPGGNNLQAFAWEKAKAHPGVQIWLRLGWISEGGDTSQPEGVPPPESLSKYNAPTAIGLAESETDPAVLRRWLNNETRAQVKQAIHTKLAAIEAVDVQAKRQAEVKAAVADGPSKRADHRAQVQEQIREKFGKRG